MGHETGTSWQHLPLSDKAVLIRESSHDIFLSIIPTWHSLVLWRLYNSMRQSDSCRLFMVIRKPHKPVASCPIVRWLKDIWKLAGVEVPFSQVINFCYIRSWCYYEWDHAGCRLEYRVSFQMIYYTDPRMICHIVGQHYCFQLATVNYL